ncbi:MAG: flagellar brake protein [Janthinobacterium lividum]
MPFWNQWRRGNLEVAAGDRAPLPQVGDTVRLHAGANAEVGVYQARVKALGLRRILLESPEMTASSEDLDLPFASALPPRTSLTLSFIRGDNLYQCETRVAGPAKAGSLAVIRPRIVTKVQRRQFYRLPLQSPTTFRVRGEGGSTMPVAARLVNLSGGGALLASGKPVPGGLRVLVRVPTGKLGDLLDIESDALDCRVATQGLARIYLIRLRFLGPPHLTEEDREEIVAYIFEQQRMLLRNRKLLRA